MLRLAFVFVLMALPVCAAEPEPVDVMQPAEYAQSVAQFDYAAHTVKLERFTELAESGGVVIDLRSREAYDAGHYKGAQWLGPDVTAEALAAIAPDKAATLLFYCNNSLQATRMMSLTDVALPQAAALGYANVFKLDALWTEAGETSADVQALFAAEKAD